MAALTKARNTPFRAGETRSFPVAASSTIFAGSMVALNATGYLIPADFSGSLKVVGRAEADVDNSAGANGTLSCETRTGIFQFANSAGGDLITRADIGASCYSMDDQTVAKTDGAGTRSIAGKIFDVDAQGVWVQF